MTHRKRHSEKLTQMSIFSYYNPSKPISISADASNYGLEVTIFQVEKGKLKVIIYSSCPLSLAKKYAQMEKKST